MAGLTLDALFQTIEETIESREQNNLNPEIIKRKLLQLNEFQTALNKRTVGQASNDALRRNITEIKEKIIKHEDELWLSFTDDYCLNGNFSDIITVPTVLPRPSTTDAALPSPQDESLMIFGLLDELDIRDTKVRLYRHLSQLANEHTAHTPYGALVNWATRRAVFTRRNSALTRVKHTQRVQPEVRLVARYAIDTLQAPTALPSSAQCPLLIRLCNRVLTPLLMRSHVLPLLSPALLDDLRQLFAANHAVFGPQFIALWTALDAAHSSTSVFVLGQMSSLLVRALLIQYR
jgi:hypothetical protein